MKSTIRTAFTCLAASAALSLPMISHAGGSHVAASKALSPLAMADVKAASTPVTTQPTGDLLSYAKQTGSFNTWVSAIEKAGLSDMFKSGEYTVFAPTDEAFSKIPTDKWQALINDQAKLNSFVKSHIVDKTLLVGDVPKDRIRNLAGENLDIQANRRHKLVVGGADIVVPDLIATNGVLHGIDRVIMAN